MLRCGFALSLRTTRISSIARLTLRYGQSDICRGVIRQGTWTDETGVGGN